MIYIWYERAALIVVTDKLPTETGVVLKIASHGVVSDTRVHDLRVYAKFPTPSVRPTVL